MGPTWWSHYRCPLPEGTRILLFRMDNDPNPIESGEKGTVEGGNDSQLWVKWDNGRSLNLAIPDDKYRVVLEHRPRRAWEDECCHKEHPNWKHATDATEVTDALAEGRIVIDLDGDLVTDFDPVERDYSFYDDADKNYPVGRATVGHVSEFLLVDSFDPVTDEELAEVYRSLGVTGQ